MVKDGDMLERIMCLEGLLNVKVVVGSVTFKIKKIKPINYEKIRINFYGWLYV